ncbi:unnamed protein product [Allacma fusca]|uniref:Uncharacterized protein n=1 Tax=Allacma fusca TaxID=39272 RepID=A0A8J2KQ94_9HEXA|nr:unnamed protein product [Allacma fusca]
MTGRLSDNKFETPVIIGNESSFENASVTAVGEQSESPMEVKLIPENYGEEEEAYGFSYLRQDTYKTFPKKTTNGRDSPPIKKFKGKLWPQVYASFAANMGSMALGTVVAWTATALPDMRKSEAWKTLDPSQESWIGSIMTTLS